MYAMCIGYRVDDDLDMLPDLPNYDLAPQTLYVLGDDLPRTRTDMDRMFNNNFARYINSLARNNILTFVRTN